MLAVAGSGCNQLFGLDAPARGDGGGGDDGGGDDAGDDGDASIIDANPNDPDGDGVLNANDNCPSVFNPNQADEDADAEINGGDACDLCPHRAGSTPGAPHGNVDNDGVGDECDPNVGIKHCMRWFDGFNGAEEVLDLYQRTGGTWKVENGALEQVDVEAPLAEATIGGVNFDRPVVAATGIVRSYASGTIDAGAVPSEVAVGVVGARINTGPGTCFGLAMRRATTPTLAQIALFRENQLSEIVVAEATVPNAQLTFNERVETTLDLSTTPATPRVIGRLPDDNVMETTATGPTTCSQLGRAGVRTHYATFSYQYLYVIEAASSATCPPRGP
jgi:hypothetical protein